MRASHHRIERGAELVADAGEELGLGAARRFRLLLGAREAADQLVPIGGQNDEAEAEPHRERRLVPPVGLGEGCGGEGGEPQGAGRAQMARPETEPVAEDDPEKERIENRSRRPSRRETQAERGEIGEHGEHHPPLPPPAVEDDVNEEDRGVGEEVSRDGEREGLAQRGDKGEIEDKEEGDHAAIERHLPFRLAVKGTKPAPRRIETLPPEGRPVNA